VDKKLGVGGGGEDGESANTPDSGVADMGTPNNKTNNKSGTVTPEATKIEESKTETETAKRRGSVTTNWLKPPQAVSF